MTKLLETLHSYGYPIERLDARQRHALRNVSRLLGDEGNATVPLLERLRVLHTLDAHELAVMQSSVLFEAVGKSETITVNDPSVFDAKTWWTNWGQSAQRAAANAAAIKESKLSSEATRKELWNSLGPPSSTGETTTRVAASILQSVGSKPLGVQLGSCLGEPRMYVLQSEGGATRELVAFPVIDNLDGMLGFFASLTLLCAQLVGAAPKGEGLVFAVKGGSGIGDVQEAKNPRSSSLVVRRFKGNVDTFPIKRADGAPNLFFKKNEDTTEEYLFISSRK